MKISQNKFIINHNSRNNNASNCLSPMNFYKTTNTTTAATVTVAIMIFMHAIVSVNTTKTVDHTRPDTEITNTTTTTTTKPKAAKVTWTKTLYDLSKNPIITQQSPKISTKIQTPPSLFSSSAAASAALNSFLMSNSKTIATTTTTMAQPPARTVKTYALATTLGECKSLTAAWGDVNPNIFYICDTQTKKPLQLRCPEGSGFFLGLGYSGCIPYEQWPACVLSGHLEQVAVCDSEHMQQPWEYKNPNKFFVCLKETIEPTILNCESGKGFVHAIVTTSAGSSSGGAGITSEILGCANWEKWRNYMHCNDYY